MGWHLRGKEAKERTDKNWQINFLAGKLEEGTGLMGQAGERGQVSGKLLELRGGGLVEWGGVVPKCFRGIRQVGRTNPV